MNALSSFIHTVLSGIGKGADFILSKGATAAVSSLQIAAPFVAMLNPAAGAILQKVSGTILGVEAMVTAEKQGVLKKQTASQIITAELPLMEEITAQFGARVVIPEAELGAVIDATVAQYNATDKLIKAIEAANPKKPA